VTGSLFIAHTGTELKGMTEQEGWLSPTERAFVSFCNQPKSRRFAGGGIWLLQESKAYFGLTWVRPWYNRRKCHMDEKRIQCLSNALQHVPIYLSSTVSQ